MLFCFSLGVLVGFLGIGGGFLIIPTLILFFNVPIKEAVPISLCIIALNSFIGFASHYHELAANDYRQMSIFIILTFMGMFLGSKIGRHINNSYLKKGLGWGILSLAMVMSGIEIFKNFF